MVESKGVATKWGRDVCRWTKRHTDERTNARTSACVVVWTQTFVLSETSLQTTKYRVKQNEWKMNGWNLKERLSQRANERMNEWVTPCLNDKSLEISQSRPNPHWHRHTHRLSGRLHRHGHRDIFEKRRICGIRCYCCCCCQWCLSSAAAAEAIAIVDLAPWWREFNQQTTPGTSNKSDGESERVRRQMNEATKTKTAFRLRFAIRAQPGGSSLQRHGTRTGRRRWWRRWRW